MDLKRRTLIRTTLAAGVAAGISPKPFSFAQERTGARKAKFKVDLTPGAIGIGAQPRDVIELAHAHGFESVQPDAGFLAGLDSTGRKEIAAELKERQLVWGSASMPVDFRKEEEQFQSGMKRLPGIAASLEEAGATRISTYLLPFHGSLTYLSNFNLHRSRLREITKVVSDHGLRFGLEYVGTRSLWTSSRFAFIHTMAETRELIAEVDQPGLGFVLDSWHWHMAEETADDILTLSNEDIVACDLNDAPDGVALDQQQDNRRELPAATGVIDIGAFLKALVKIGYDGPVRAEPFNQPLRDLDDAPAAEATARAIRKAMEIAGV